MKHEFGGNDAWILSYREECFEQIGLKPSIKIPLFNGSLECEFRKYTLFDGKMKEFRQEGGIVKSEEEKQEMAQKHRFKKNREFKERLEAEAANEEGDIRSFQFHSLSNDRPSYNRNNREDGRDRFNRGEEDKFGYGRRNKFDASKRNFKNNKRDFKGRRRGVRDDYEDHDDFRPRRRDNGFKPRRGRDDKDGNRRRDKQYDRNNSFDNFDNED